MAHGSQARPVCSRSLQPKLAPPRASSQVITTSRGPGPHHQGGHAHRMPGTLTAWLPSPSRLPTRRQYAHVGATEEPGSEGCRDLLRVTQPVRGKAEVQPGVAQKPDAGPVTRATLPPSHFQAVHSP